MEATEQLQGSATAVSPSGQLLACIANGKLRIHYAQAPERATDIKIRPQGKDISSIKWSPDGNFIQIFSPNLVEILDLEDDTHRIRFDNGSGGLGRFASADFVGNTYVLVVWEFGKAKLWDLQTGKGTELVDLKTKCEGRNWALRPGQDGETQTLALLSRIQAQDHLTIHFPSTGHTMAQSSLTTADARGLYWSPDGNWLAIPDTAHAYPSLHIYTPSGHLFRSYPTTQPCPDNDPGLSLKSLVWSSTSHLLALARYDATITLLSTRTFSPLAVIEHSQAIDQRHLSSTQTPAIIYQETVSPSHVRSYTCPSQPLSLPLSRTKPSTEPSEMGIAELRFSADGRFLATRDERMQSTVWIWDTFTLHAHAVLVQHNNVRRMHWHPTSPSLLLLDSGESIAYLFDASANEPPTPISVSLPATPTFSFAPTTDADAKPTILAATKTTFTLLYPYGRASSPFAQPGSSEQQGYEEGVSEDSLLEVLTGRKPMPERSEPSYTEQVDWEAEAEAGAEEGGLEDTFREKRKVGETVEEKDPLDDSEIF